MLPYVKKYGTKIRSRFFLTEGQRTHGMSLHSVNPAFLFIGVDGGWGGGLAIKEGLSIGVALLSINDVWILEQ